MISEITKDKHYSSWLMELKQRVRQAQLKAAVSVNTELLKFYWSLGADIFEKQTKAAWGSGFLKQLSQDLMAEFPDMKGFSEANLHYIRRWFLFYYSDIGNSGTACARIEPQTIAQLTQIPWGHNRVIISKCSDVQEALFYVRKTIENNWSRSVLTHQIEGGLYVRQGKSINNFIHTLPSPQSELAQQILKDPYNFDFLGLVAHVAKFLLELGAGFAYMGKQFPLQVGERDFFLDMLFYHTRLHCHVVIELKTGDFEPEHAGKLNFYIKAVDEQLRKDGDSPTIGILLCKHKDKLVAEYGGGQDLTINLKT